MAEKKFLSTRRRVRLLRWLAFILAFQVQIQIRATPKQLAIPGDCHKKVEFPCAVKTLGAALHLKNKFQIYHVAKKSVYQSNTQFEHQLQEGDFWIEESKEGLWKTPFVEISGRARTFWVHAESLRTTIRNLDGIPLELKSRSGQKVVIPSGFEGWVGEIDDQGKNLIGVVHPIELKNLIKDWYPLFPGKDQDFAAEIQKLKERWYEVSEMASELYRQNEIEQVKQLHDEKAARAAAIQRKEVEKKQARQLFLNRSFSR